MGFRPPVMRYGSFPLRFSRLFGGLLGIAVGGALGLGLLPDSLTCPSPTAECRLERSVPRAATTAHRSSPFSDGSTISLKSVEPPAARRFSGQVNDALESGTPIDASLHESWLLAVMMLLFGGIGVASLWMALRGLAVTTSTTTRETTSSVAGGRSSEFRYGVATCRPVTWWTSRSNGAPEKTRFMGVTSTLLACPPRSPETTKQLDASAGAYYPALGTLEQMGRGTLAYIGLCCGSILGIGVYAVGSVALGFHHMKDPAGGPELLFGAAAGAAAGVAVMFRLARPRTPR
ncbi:MAG TPA: hypothetical protein VH062_33510 [Polyangiaceae bacterium]|jgi:hypothetical protein|nr:hypothetical protein [Polyangiaceae bacterium]